MSVAYLNDVLIAESEAVKNFRGTDRVFFTEGKIMDRMAPRRLDQHGAARERGVGIPNDIRLGRGGWRGASDVRVEVVRGGEWRQKGLVCRDAEDERKVLWLGRIRRFFRRT